VCRREKTVELFVLGYDLVRLHKVGLELLVERGQRLGHVEVGQLGVLFRQFEEGLLVLVF